MSLSGLDKLANWIRLAHMGRKSNSGSAGKVRKDNDKVDLHPLTKRSKGSGAPAAVSESPPTCPMGFEVSLPVAPSVREGVQVDLRHQDGKWLAVIAGKAIAELSRAQSAMISRCQEAGYRYRGWVKTRTNGSYGEFQRSPA
jgi:hypothetical protein